MWRWSARLAALVLIAIAAYGLFAALWGVPSVADHPLAHNPATIAAGKYLAAAGDCASCHTAEGGEAFAGGRPLVAPFGTIYSANITPDPKTGIGDLNSAQFYQLLAYGADSPLAPLYPAMPYTSFHNITREDSDALFAYFMSVPAVKRPATPNEMAFPFNIRPLMFGWNVLFASRRPFEKNSDKDEVWNRGAYLVEGLGHCGECHTSRNVFGAMERNRALEGAVIGEFEAPNITATALVDRGWNREDLALFFEAGASPQGSAFGDMFLATKNSLRLLTHDDRMAIATYLMDVDGTTPSKGDTLVSRDASLERLASEYSLLLGHGRPTVFGWYNIFKVHRVGTWFEVAAPAETVFFKNRHQFEHGAAFAQWLWRLSIWIFSKVDVEREAASV